LEEGAFDALLCGFPIFLFQRPRAKIETLRAAHVLQQRYREALFGEALLHKLPFTVGQLGFLRK
jgi:hypothetical protein